MTEPVELEESVTLSESKSLWVFAYGSLCWKPGFQFDKAVTGYIKGYSRKFWQGNKTHRGTEKKPGRVATLIEDKKESIVYGVAYAISGEAAIPYLSKRECTLGGYDTHFTTFYPYQGEAIKNILLYIATPKNSLWLGDAPVSVIANEIVETSGPCGHNVEYLLRLAMFVRQHFPEQEDCHLFTLEKQVLLTIEERKMCLKTLMGDDRDCLTFTKALPSSSSPPRREEEQERVDSFQHTTRVPEKTLRCLNI